MVVLQLARASVARRGSRSLSSTSAGPPQQPFYQPTLVEKRASERGTGGRMSESGVKVAVFGATGLLGTHVCGHLGANGYMTYVANRGDDLEVRDLKIAYDLGRLRTTFYSPRDKDSIREVIADADIVLNLIGKYYESGQPVAQEKFPYIGYQTNYSYEDTNVMIPQTLAEICKEMQVDNFVHVSSASARPDARSRWSRTKYEGELAVKEAFPWATIIRPTQLFGSRDRLLNWFGFIQQYIRCVPLIHNGNNKEALTQPVYANDVAKTILAICDDASKFEGRTIDCFGPADFTYKELATFVNDITQQNKRVFDVPIDWYRQIAKFAQNTRNPMITPDQVELWSEDFLPAMTPEEYKAQPDTADKILTMADVGITALPIEREAFNYLHVFRAGGHFHRVGGYH